MATKDWKKFGINGWIRKDNKNFVKVIQISNLGENIIYKVQTQLRADKTFKTKTQALKFTRAYMRKH